MSQRETLAFKNAKIITPMRVIDNGVLIVENGKISSIGPGTEVKIPQEIKVIDVADKYLAPGFIDIHLHGAVFSYPVTARFAMIWVSALLT